MLSVNNYCIVPDRPFFRKKPAALDILTRSVGGRTELLRRPPHSPLPVRVVPVQDGVAARRHNATILIIERLLRLAENQQAISSHTEKFPPQIKFLARTGDLPRGFHSVRQATSYIAGALPTVDGS